MTKVVRAFLCTEQRQERANCSVDTRNASRCDLAQERLELAVWHLDRVEVGRICRQIANGRSRFLYHLSNAGTHMDPAVVHHDDVIALQGWTQTLLKISQKHLRVHRPLEDHRRSHFVVPHGSNERECLPASKRDLTNHSDSARRPASESHHARSDRSFVEKHQPGGIEQALLTDPTSARPGDICSLSLRSLQAFF